MVEREENEELKTSQMLLVTMLMAFSALLIILNVLMKWEFWTIPLLAVTIPAGLIMHIFRRPDYTQRTNIYAVILMVEMFYYTSQAETVYDGSGVVVVMLVLFTTTGRRGLNWLCYLIGNAGMGMHLLQRNSENALIMEQSHIVRTIWVFVIVFMAAVVTDRVVVMRRRSTAAFEQQIHASEEVNRSAGDFLANVSHEIRTPINAVIGLSGVCIDREDDADIRMDLDSIRDAGKRVAEQVSDILDFSEIDRSRLAVNMEDYMMSSLLNDLVLELRPYMKPELELVIDVDPELPSMLHSDVSKLKKILWHLIMNGLKYTKQGGVYTHITTIPKDYGVNLMIEVQDTGIGMNDEELNRVFDRFYQSDSGRTRSSSGLGLGMPIVAGFVRILGGFITVESEYGKGTVVRVSIPQQVIDNSVCMSVVDPKELRIAGFLHFDKFPHPQVREYYNVAVRNIVRGLGVTMHWVENAEDLQRLVSEMDITHLFVGEAECRANMELIEKVAEKALVEVVAGQQFRLPRGSRIHIMRKPFYCFPVTSALNVFWNRGDEEEGRLFCPGVRALVVDDEPMNLTVAIGVFRGYGMVVETADSGMESIEKCRKTRYDIVFMDHMMPGMDGVEAMKRLRMEAGRQNQNFPIVALTANAVSSAKEMFLREGFDGFVSKPIEIMELERVLKHVLPKDVIRYEKNDGNASRMSMSETISPGARITRPDTDRQSAAESEPTDKPDRLPEPRTEPRDEPDAIDLSGLAEYDIDSRTGMRYCQEDVSFYRKLLLQFAKESEKKKSGMRESLSRQAYDEYAVYVHALKSTAKMIGAAELSERARQLEEAGKAGNGDFILASQDDLLELYEKTVNGIRSVCGEESAGASVASDSSDGVLEFAPSGSSGEDEVLEFAPSNASVTQDDEVLEFAPKGGGNA